MSTVRCPLLLAVMILLVLWSCGPGRCAAPPVRPRDLAGDPLPAGAVARLGSTRLSQPGVGDMAFSPDGKALACYDDMGTTVRLWDLTTGKLLWSREIERFRGKAPNWSLLGFSSDNKLVVMAGPDKSVRVWERTNGRLRYWQTFPFDARVVRFAPDSRHLVIGGYSDTVHVWDLEGSSTVRLGDLKRVDYLTYLRDAKALVSAHFATNELMSCSVWTVLDGKLKARHEVPRLQSGFAPALSPDGRFLAIPDKDGKKIRLYDPATGKLLRRTEGEADYPRELRFSADGSVLTATCRDGMARVWATDTGKLRHHFRAAPGVIRRVALSTDGKVLALARQGRADGECIRLWDLSGAKPRPVPAAPPGHEHGPLTIAFSADSKTVLTASRESGMRTPALDGVGWSLRRWQADTGRQTFVRQEYTGGEVRWTRFSPDGRLLAVVTHDGTLRMWDTAAGKELRRWQVPTRDFGWFGAGKVVRKFPMTDITDLTFNADGQVLLANHLTALHRWDVSTGKALKTFTGWEKTDTEFPGRESLFYQCRCTPSPDGETLLLRGWLSNKTRLVLVSAASGHKRRELPPEAVGSRSAAFSPDGRTLAVDAPDTPAETNVIRLLEVETGRDRGWLKNAPGGIAALAFSPDGRLLVAGGWWMDTVLRVWDLATGDQPRRLPGHDQGVHSLVFSPDGRLLASAGKEPSALLWDVRALVAQRAPTPGRLSQTELDGLWKQLAGADAARAYAAIWKLAGTSRQSVPFLRSRLNALSRPDAKAIARLVAQLDDDDFATRERASRELEKLGQAAESALRKAHGESRSLEVRRRAAPLLEALEKADRLPSPRLIALRVLEALEKAGTAEARELVAELARGPQEDDIARAARAAARRLEKRAISR